MDAGPTAISLTWNPFATRLPVKSVLENFLSLGGVADAADRKFGLAPGGASLSNSGQIVQKTVVSETTTIQIRSSSAYKVDTVSAADATSENAAGKVLASAPGGGGDVNVVTADATESVADDAGSISVDTKVTYSDGSTSDSSAWVTSTFKTGGGGLAARRLDALLDGATSEGAVMSRLGLGQPQTAEAAVADAPTGVAVQTAVSSSVSATLTYVQQGDARRVNGLETGSGNALIAAFDPTQISYDGSGLLSTTRESMSFAATITGGSLFSDPGAAWMTGAVTESTASDTNIPAANAIDISRQSTVSGQFATGAASSTQSVQAANAVEVSFAGSVANGSCGSERETITVGASDSESSFALSNSNGARVRDTSSLGQATVSIGWAPFTSAPPLVIANTPLTPQTSVNTFA